MLENISGILPSNTYVKFHPRDSIIKKNRILETTRFKELSINVEAAEFIINSPELLVLSGYLSSTLLVASELRPSLEINSFVGLLGNQKINNEALRIISNDFPNINFHGLI